MERILSNLKQSCPEEVKAFAARGQHGEARALMTRVASISETMFPGDVALHDIEELVGLAHAQDDFSWALDVQWEVLRHSMARGKHNGDYGISNKTRNSLEKLLRI